jgi:prenyl protein peptidase
MEWIREAAKWPIGWGLGWSAVFVGSLYLWSESRNVSRRDDPPVVKKRLISVLGVCALGFVLTPATLKEQGLWNAQGGVSWIFLSSAAGLASVSILFLGPLLQRIVTWDSKEDIPDLTDILTWRNIIVAPLAEEYVFRSCIVPIFIQQGWSRWATVAVAPWMFSAAHLHHILKNQRWLPTLFQMTYTALFGAISTYLFVCTGSVYAPAIAHCFCNYMGFPDIQGALEHKYKTGMLFRDQISPPITPVTDLFS